MEVPLKLSFKNLEPSEAVAFAIRKWVDRLEKYYPQIISCHVVVAVPHRHHRRGNIYEVHINLRIPREEIVVRQHQKLAIKHKDIYVAIHDAFDAAKRVLDEHKQIQRGYIKKPSSNYTTGHVVRLLQSLEGDEDYGFLQTEDNREIYFHRNTVRGQHYDQLKVGTLVRFFEEKGDSGPQARSVFILNKIRKAS